VQPLPTMYAFRDAGELSPTRWKPRLVACTKEPSHSDDPGEMFVVKYRRGSQSTAANISEVICHGLLLASGIPTLDAVLISVSNSLSSSYRLSDVIDYDVMPGLHFGTRHRTDVQPGDSNIRVDDLAQPEQLIDIWVFDCWTMNIDRATYGNILMARDHRGKWQLVACDQSDCFGGSGRFADGSFMGIAEGNVPSESCSCLIEAIYRTDGRAVSRAVDRITGALGSVQSAVERVPDQWWDQSAVKPEEVERCLNLRCRMLPDICQAKKWGDINDACRGGYILGT